MKLLRIVHSLNPAGGGVAEAIRQFGMTCSEYDFELTVLTLDSPAEPYSRQNGFSVVAVGPASGSYGYSAQMKIWLEANVDDFDAVVVDGLWKYSGKCASSICRKKRKPYYVMPHGMLDPWFGRTYPLKHLKKQLYWLLAEYRVIRNANGVIFTAEEEAMLARHSFRPYAAREKICPIGIEVPDTDRVNAVLAFRRLIPGCGERPYLLYLGRIQEKKGVDMLIDAYLELEKVSDAVPFNLVIAGPAITPDYLKMLTDKAGSSESIHFVGMLAGVEKWGALSGAKALILPSHQENFGIVVAEALAVGTPVLLTRRVNIWREVCNAGAGWSDEDNLPGILSLIQRLQSATDETLRDMSIRSRMCYKQNFSRKACVLKMLDILKGEHSKGDG